MFEHSCPLPGHLFQVIHWNEWSWSQGRGQPIDRWALGVEQKSSSAQSDGEVSAY